MNPETVIRNFEAFMQPYGLPFTDYKNVRAICNSMDQVVSAGVLIRDARDGTDLISCEFPFDQDVTNQLFWVPVDNRSLTAMPYYTRVSAGSLLTGLWEQFKTWIDKREGYILQQGAVQVKANPCLAKQGVIESYFPDREFGFVRRSRKGVYFNKKWCSTKTLEPGTEVRFIPVMCFHGLQARALQGVTI